jgi:uncharacterized protein
VSLLCIDELGEHAGVTRTPSGGWVVPALIGRIGIYNYVIDGKTIRVLRTEDEVFHPESLASLARCPVTVYHPGEDEVTPENYRRVNVGWAEAPTREGRYIKAALIVQDAQTGDRIDSGDLSETSAGYHMDFAVNDDGSFVSGVDKVFGPYDRKHTNIRYNHVAIGPKGWGRAGTTIQLDGGARYLRSMSNLVLDAADVVETPAVVPVVDAAQWAPRADLDRANARADVLQAQLDALRAEPAVKTVDSAAVAARAALVTDAKSLGFDVTPEMTDEQVRSGAVKASGLVVDGKSADYITCAFDMQVAARKVVVDSHAHAAQVVVSVSSDVVTDANDPLLAAQAASNKRYAVRT